MNDIAPVTSSAPWHATILTVFPNMFPGPLGHALAARAMDNLWTMSLVDLKDFSNRHGRIDDSPYGGGPGMVIRAEVIDKALEKVSCPGPRIVLSPRGRVFSQKLAEQWAQQPGIVLVCGRYEGIDQRVVEKHELEEISIGDYILAGGEAAACVILDACIRLLPGVVGTPESLVEESFADGLLEHPQYTRPSDWNGLSVPSVLLSGNHKNVLDWRLEQRESLTRTRRKDLWQSYCQTPAKKP